MQKKTVETGDYKRKIKRTLRYRLSLITAPYISRSNTTHLTTQLTGPDLPVEFRWDCKNYHSASDAVHAWSLLRCDSSETSK